VQRKLSQTIFQVKMLKFSPNKLILAFFAVISILLMISSCSRKLSPGEPAARTERPAGSSGRGVKVPEGSKDITTEKIAGRTRPVPADLVYNEIPDAFWFRGAEKKLDTGSIDTRAIIDTALDYLGVPHCMGGKTRRCMDCSGFLLSVFANHGIHLPHSSEEQARYGTIVFGTENLRKGDLVFFTRSYRTGRFITHSGIYTGNNEFIHTSSSRGVTVTSIHDPWWNEKFVFGTRILDN
jgi:murein DD-endopeptidase / murein LD-carboxypeptidase